MLLTHSLTLGRASSMRAASSLEAKPPNTTVGQYSAASVVLVSRRDYLQLQIDSELTEFTESRSWVDGYIYL